jgi:hypothetical protein
MLNVKFDGAREFIDFMKNKSKRIWISADDPVKMTFKAVDENLEFVLEITVADYKESEHLLNEKEQKIFRNDKGGNKGYWELTGEKLSEHQEFLLSPEYWQGMANYLQRRFRKEMKESLLRVKGDIEYLPNITPCYDVDPKKGAYFVDETGEKIVKVKGHPRMILPFFEIGQSYFKECETIWDVEADSFIKNDILTYENSLYNRIIEEIGEVRQIILPFKTRLTVLPSMNWVQKKAGFSTFETLGIGIYK